MERKKSGRRLAWCQKRCWPTLENITCFQQCIRKKKQRNNTGQMSLMSSRAFQVSNLLHKMKRLTMPLRFSVCCFATLTLLCGAPASSSRFLGRGATLHWWAEVIKVSNQIIRACRVSHKGSFYTILADENAEAAQKPNKRYDAGADGISVLETGALKGSSPTLRAAAVSSGFWREWRTFLLPQTLTS